MTPVIQTLKERKLFQWAVAYLAGAWVTLQVLDLVGDKFGWPDSVGRITIVLLAVGFLAVLVLAWFHGEKGQQRVSGVELAMLAGVLVLAGASVYLVRGQDSPDLGAAPARTATAGAAKSIAVLPFKSFTADTESDAFASGLQDEILTQLSKVGALKVISRTSMQQYAGTSKSIPQIARELNVSSVLEGSVQRAGNQVRVQAQLIDASSDEHLWAEKYDGDFSQVFLIQSDIAQKIAGALAAQLTAGERALITAKPTENSKAYDLYIQGRQYTLRPGYLKSNFEHAQSLFESAIALDTSFALAHAWLSVTHGRMHWFAHDRRPARVERARKAAETALRLQPDLPESHYAMGMYHYFGRREYDRALAEFEIVLKSTPSDANVAAAIAFINRRKGRMEEAAKGLEQALSLDPRNATFWVELGDTYSLLHRYTEAEPAYRSAGDFAPDDVRTIVRLSWVYVYLQGRPDSLGATLARAAASSGGNLQDARRDAVHYGLLTRDADAILRFLPGTDEGGEYQLEYLPRSLAQAWAHQLKGDSVAARAAFKRAAALAARLAREHPEDPRYHIALGHCYAGLGRRAEAVRHARIAMQAMPPARDAFFAALYQQYAAQVMADAGDANAAIPLLGPLLTSPSSNHRVLMRLYPFYDPIRDDPRFQELVKGR